MIVSKPLNFLHQKLQQKQIDDKNISRGLKINTAAVQRTKETGEQGRQVLVNPTELKYLKLDNASSRGRSVTRNISRIWKIFVELMFLNQYLKN